MNTAVWIFLAFILIGTVSSVAKLFGYNSPTEPSFANYSERRRHRWICITWAGLLFSAIAARTLMPQIPSPLVIGTFLVLAVFSQWLFAQILFPHPDDSPE